MVGSTINLGLGLLTTAEGGANWRGAIFGSFPLLACKGSIAAAAAAAHDVLFWSGWDIGAIPTQ